jgi:hypothetical protein
MFVRTKIIDGKKRRYLVESYYDKTTKKRRQRHIAYIDLWPEKDVKKLIKIHKEYSKALANSERPDVTKAYKRVAVNNAANLWKRIEKFRRAVHIDVTLKRRSVDHRIVDRISQKLHSSSNPFLDLLHYFNPMKLSKLEDILNRLAANEHFGAVCNWPAERKEIVRLKIEPIKKRIGKLWADVSLE